MVKCKGAFTSNGVFLNVGTMVVTSNEVLEVMNIQLDQQKEDKMRWSAVNASMDLGRLRWAYCGI